MSGDGLFTKLLDPLNLFGINDPKVAAPAAPATPPAADSAATQDEITKRQRIAAQAVSRSSTLLTGTAGGTPGVSGDASAGKNTLLGGY